MSGQLIASAEDYLRAQGLNPQAPIINSDAIAAGATPIEQLLALLGLAANASDPADNGQSVKGQAERDAKTAEAAAKFPAQDEAATQEMAGVAQHGAAAGQQDPASQMAQQIPQMASGIAGALAGALGGALQPLAQIPQQLAQAAQGAMQSGMGAMQQSSAEELTPEELAAQGLGDGLGADGMGEDAGGGGGGSAGGGGGTTPTAMLGPPPTPTGATVPTAGRGGVPIAAPPSVQPTMMSGGMGGMPMVPPGAMHGAGGADGKDDKTATKRVAAPTVKNGAPVQGRITTPPPTSPVAKKIDGPVVATRRIVVPGEKDQSKAGDKGDSQNT